MKPTFAGSIVVASILFAESGCTSLNPGLVTITPDYAALERDLSATYATKLGTPVDRVSCPDVGPVKLNQPFYCDVYVGDRSFRLAVKYPKVDSGWEAKKSQGVLVNLTKLRGDIEQEVSQQGASGVKADCGPGLYKVVVVGDTFSCVITAPNGRHADVPAKVTDEGGGVDFSVDLRPLTG